jgi:lipid A ethanolaminephosphotransferase
LLTLQASHDAAMLFVSDHGESLGENGLYLHGLPWAIAPREPLAVPMVAWFSPGFAAAGGLDLECV